MALTGLLVVATAGAGVVAGALVVPQPVPPLVASVAVESNETIAVSEQVFDGARQVAATPKVAAARVLRARSTGVVTSSECAVGRLIASGSVPLFVDGQPVIALASTSPLWRDLARGDKGTDVTALQGELARLGRDVKTTGVYDFQTATVVRQLVEEARGTLPVGGVLPQSLFLWLPSPEVTVSSCAVAVGDTLSSGQELAAMAGELTELRIAPPAGDGWVARHGERRTSIDADGRIGDPAFLAAVQASPEYQLMRESDGATGLTVTVELEQPRTTVVVPPSAVVVAGPGDGCVVSQGRAVAVEIVSSSLGQTLVQPTEAGPPITEVDVHPDPSVTCP